MQITSQGFLNNTAGEGDVKDLNFHQMVSFQFQPASEGLIQEQKKMTLKCFHLLVLFQFQPANEGLLIQEQKKMALKCFHLLEKIKKILFLDFWMKTTLSILFQMGAKTRVQYKRKTYFINNYYALQQLQVL